MFTYDPANGWLLNTRNPMLNTTILTPDAAGRVRQVQLPTGKVVKLDFDNKDNLTGVTPAGKPQHQLDFFKTDVLKAYRPPSRDLAANAAPDPVTGALYETDYQYDLDKFLTLTTQPSGVTITQTPDPSTGKPPRSQGSCRLGRVAEGRLIHGGGLDGDRDAEALL